MEWMNQSVGVQRRDVKQDSNLNPMKRKTTLLRPIVKKQKISSVEDLCFRFSLAKSLVAPTLALVKSNQDDITTFLKAIQQQQGLDSVFELLRVGRLSRENVLRFCTGTFYRCSTKMECDICFEMAVGNFQLPCGACCCLECLRTGVSNNLLEKAPRISTRKGDQINWCPCVGNCSKQMSPLLVNVVLSEVCGLCGKSDSKLTTVRCSHSHKFCVSCLSASVERQVADKQPIVCPRFSQCRYHIPAAAVHRVLNRHLRSFKTLTDTEPSAEALQLVKAKRAYAQNRIARAVEEDPFQRICPAPGCTAVINVPNVAKLPGAKPVACACPECARKWCSACWHLAHPGLKCSEARTAKSEWRQFLHTHETACGPEFRDRLATHVRQKKEAKDTSRNTRRCPHCKRGPIFRIDGCPVMTCGKDAPDKDGVVRYSGCGKTFNWDRSDGHDADLPFSLPYYVNVQFEPPAAPKLLEVQRYGTHTPKVSCSICNEVVRGTLFKCIQCPTTVLCWTCTREMISCSAETLNKNAKLSPDLVELVVRGELSQADAFKMMPELLSRHVEHTFKVVQPKRLKGVVITRLNQSARSPSVVMIRAEGTVHVIFGKKFRIGATVSFSMDDTTGPVDLHRSDHGSEVYPLGVAQLNGTLANSEKIEVSQITTALQLKFLSERVYGRKPRKGQVGVLKVTGGAFIKDHCCISDFYSSSTPIINLSYDEITEEDACRHMGSNWRNLVAATHNFTVWNDKRDA